MTKHKNGLPFALHFPYSFDYPKEKVAIIDAYLHFAGWATSGGVISPDWYENKPGNRQESLIY
ncbi:MAG: DUF4842 domain-containing protein [Bacteroidia bacterium]|nr:DUF4842 domain-containing protein [Bacteroidia bacterium]